MVSSTSTERRTKTKEGIRPIRLVKYWEIGARLDGPSLYDPVDHRARQNSRKAHFLYNQGHRPTHARDETIAVRQTMVLPRTEITTRRGQQGPSQMARELRYKRALARSIECSFPRHVKKTPHVDANH
jgi:hypothetical protein